MPKFINLGCGSRFCNDPVWTNVDFNSTYPNVIAHNLLDGIPFPDSSFDAAYHSHVLEHLTEDDGLKFISECFRTLKPGGVLRVAVPDLEQICRLYLETLALAEQGDTIAAARYEWIKLELYDQTTRTNSGGEMAKYLSRPDLPDKEFVIARVGTVARKLIQAAQSSAARPKRAARPPQTLRGLLKSALLTQHEQAALRIGLFRLSGEVHQQMYDRYSLGALLTKAGFTAARRCSAGDSLIPGWGAYFLDVDPDGFEHAPSSLYMEGVKPA